MAFHVRDQKTESLVREVARRRGLGITATIRAVFEEVVAADCERARSKGEDLMARLKPLLHRVSAMPKSGISRDGRFRDLMRGQGGD